MTNREALIEGFKKRGLIDSEGVWVNEKQRRIYGGTQENSSCEVLETPLRDDVDVPERER